MAASDERTGTGGYAVTQDLGQYVLVDEAHRATALIDPNAGNNVTHFRVTPAGRDLPIDVFLPPTGPEGLGPNGYGAGNPILFPFPNRVRGGEYAFRGRRYRLHINEPARGNHIHGLVCKLAWDVEAYGSSAAEGAWLRAVVDLSAHDEVMRQYPFPCRLAVTTRLKHAVLIQDATVTNTGQTAMPMGYGTHPWFPATLEGGSRRQTEVRILAARYWELAQLVPTGRTIPVEENAAQFDLRQWRALEDREYDDVFTDVLRRADGWVEAGIRYPNVGLEVAVEASPEFREWVLYAPTTRPVICLEPYTCTTNAINLQEQGIDAGLIVLEPGATWHGTIRTSLRQS
jgi:aldose 1-epimerase